MWLGVSLAETLQQLQAPLAAVPTGDFVEQLVHQVERKRVQGPVEKPLHIVGVRQLAAGAANARPFSDSLSLALSDQLGDLWIAFGLRRVSKRASVRVPSSQVQADTGSVLRWLGVTSVGDA